MATVESSLQLESKATATALPGAAQRRGYRARLTRRTLAIADLAGLVSAFLLAQTLFGASELESRLSSTSELLVFVATLPAWLVLASLYRLYDRDRTRTSHTTADDLNGVFHLTTVGTFTFVATTALLGLADPALDKSVVFWLSATLLVVLARAVARTFIRRRPSFQENAVIVGAGVIGQLVGRKLVQHPEFGVNVVGFVDSEPRPLRGDLADLSVVGCPADLHAVLDAFQVERVIVAFDRESDLDTLDIIRSLERDGVQIDVVPRLFDLFGPNAELHNVEGLPLIGLSPAKEPVWSRHAKRTVDLVVAGTMLLLAAPLFAVAALAIRFDSPGPVFFRQERLGRGQRPFTMLKFRSMQVGTSDADHRAYIASIAVRTAEAGANGVYKLDRAASVTRVGHWLRRTSLDELPQLINVLRGEMSLVGPRPCLEYETAFFAPHHFERFEVLPGITGLWQVTARAHSSFGESLDMDRSYVRGWSLGLDLKLLLQTPYQLIRTKGTR